MTTVWGLLFVIVLTMISGARELMTPGAWERNGSTYRLSSSTSENASHSAVASDDASVKLLGERHQRLTQLGEALVRYASLHNGRFPASLDDLEVNPAQLVISHKVGPIERTCALMARPLRSSWKQAYLKTIHWF